MPIEVVLPTLGLTMSEGTIVRWLKRTGEPVAEGEPLVVVETDKAAAEVLSPAAGTVSEILGPEGAVVPVEQVIAVLAAPGETAVPAASPAPPRAEARAPAPVARPRGRPIGRPTAGPRPTVEPADPARTGDGPAHPAPVEGS